VTAGSERCSGYGGEVLGGPGGGLGRFDENSGPGEESGYQRAHKVVKLLNTSVELQLDMIKVAYRIAAEI